VRTEESYPPLRTKEKKPGVKLRTEGLPKCKRKRKGEETISLLHLLQRKTAALGKSKTFREGEETTVGRHLVLVRRKDKKKGGL